MVLLAVESEPESDRVAAAELPALPASWPATLQLGMADSPGGASSMRTTAPFGFRYQYLAGGVNTGGGWATWNPNGAFVTYYIQDSVANNITPVFTYYMLYQSQPGVSQGEATGVITNLQNAQTMAAYYNDLKLFFQRAGGSQSRVVLHVEPDLWGFIQSSSGDNATARSVKVASTGVPELAGLPENARGFAQAIVRLRNQYAPNVLLAYHLSLWGTGVDPVLSNPSNAQIDQLAARSAAFYQSLQAGFDISFAEFTDRDAGFKQYVYGDNGASWWDTGDYSRNVRYLQGFVSGTQKRVVLWQIPFGNTKMRAMNNTWNHYQDNKVEWLLDEAARTHLQAYAQAGAVAFLFGRGADGATCACDASGDGVTNPAAINGNNLTSLNADDDGGFFRQKAASYYSTGAMPLPQNGGSPCPCSLFSATDVPTIAAVPDVGSYEVGMRFTSAQAGYVTGVKFYKGAGNGGTHVGRLWTNTGSLLASVTFTGESATGWQTASFPTAVSINAGQTYVISYGAPVGRISVTLGGFNSAISKPPLSAGPLNGAYGFGAGSFPAHSAPTNNNYFVDVVLNLSPPPPPTCPCSLFTGADVPAIPAVPDSNSYSVGVRFMSAQAGFVTGVKFYKGAGNGGTHVGRLWTVTGTLLGSVTFTGESATGWQTASFPTPIPISAGQTYIISYGAPIGRLSVTLGGFNTAISKAPLSAGPPNGVYGFGASSFPANPAPGNNNYFVDVVFN
jgi:hypothetical protein